MNLLFLALSSLFFPQSESGANTAERLREYVEHLASDKMEGRAAGYPGNDRAAKYLVDLLKKWGVKPAGRGGSYFQPFEFRKRNDRGPRSESGKAPTRNVAAWIPGSDRKLKKEVVVIGAHFDHVGTSEQADAGRAGRASAEDNIWNGADDNASGSSMLLEIARTLAEEGGKPKRSILFLWFSAEEAGLLGSKWYADHPLHPLENTVAMINLDMVGKGISKLDIGAAGTSDSWRDFISRGEKATGISPATITDKYSPDSDHASFAAKEIPTIFFFTGLHADYHRTSDHADRLDYAGMEATAKLARSILVDLANTDAPPEWTDPSQAKGEKEIDSLGVSGYEVGGRWIRKNGYSRFPKKGAGVRVTKVEADSNAAAAGIEKGDVIYAFGKAGFGSGSAVKQVDTLAGKVSSGKKVSIRIVRDGKRKTLSVRWKT
jgi:aminopeptidase YwaD